MKIKKLQEVDQYNTYLHNRIHEVMAINAAEIPRSERMVLQDRLENKILERQNFIRTGYIETVELFNKVFCPELIGNDQQILFLAVQARELIPYFLEMPERGDGDEWIESRIQRATQICTQRPTMPPTMPLVLIYSELCPYRSITSRPKRALELLTRIKELEKERDRLQRALIELSQVRKRQIESIQVFTELQQAFQREYIDIAIQSKNNHPL